MPDPNNPIDADLEAQLAELDVMGDPAVDIQIRPQGELITTTPEGMTITPIQPTPMQMLASAIDRGMSVEILEKFMDLSERHEANEARKAYAMDMAKCQAKMQPIVAEASNDQTSSSYATLGHINRQITPIYTKHGFSISFGHGEPANAGDIRTTARVLHKLGHTEDFWIDLPLDDAGIQGTTNKTGLHARASSNTYGQRYIVRGIFNLAIVDDDGNAGGGTGRISEEQALELHAMVEESGLIHSAMHREFGVKTYGDLKLAKFEKAVNRIKKLSAARKQG